MVKKKRGNPNPKLPPSRGIPADESLWLPKHYGRDIRNKGGIDSKIRWNLEDIIDFIFPQKYQPKYYKIGIDFINLILKKEKINKEDISNFLKETRYSRSTLENKIIPKLVRIGAIKREREASGRMKKKGRALIISESLTFSNYLKRIANEWETIVETARFKRNIGNNKK
ncbi:MAG: hypothetical protein DRO92_02785 [Candidatus Altiarchaeales archaeon]|nr:MAG: hypothetical protein DRO92_02785 [Candidatus Altiarchaeales archaeon]